MGQSRIALASSPLARCRLRVRRRASVQPTGTCSRRSMLLVLLLLGGTRALVDASDDCDIRHVEAIEAVSSLLDDPRKSIVRGGTEFAATAAAAAAAAETTVPLPCRGDRCHTGASSSLS